MTNLAGRIRAQLDAIPHDPGCSRRETTPRIDGDYSGAVVQWLPRCNCSRPQRIAEAVARAIQAALAEEGRGLGRDAEDAAVRALSSRTPEQEST